MTNFPTECPSCSEPLLATRLVCGSCAMLLEGRFELPELLRLKRDELAFVLDFVRCSGSLKDLGKQRGQSYPTVRNRLDEIIRKLSAPVTEPELQRRQILDALAQGNLTVKEATRKLQELDR